MTTAEPIKLNVCNKIGDENVSTNDNSCYVCFAWISEWVSEWVSSFLTAHQRLIRLELHQTLELFLCTKRCNWSVNNRLMQYKCDDKTQSKFKQQFKTVNQDSVMLQWLLDIAEAWKAATLMADDLAHEVNEQVVQLPYTLSVTSSRLPVTSLLPV